MELIKNIFFNTDILTPYMTLKISYTGKFFDDDSKEVFLRYCFDNQWDNTKDIKMEKTELGYQAEIELNNSKSLNLCFFNNKNEWDNNDSLNYDFSIEEKDFSLIEIENQYALRSYSKFYLSVQKAKINIVRAVSYIAKLVTGKYRRKVTEK